MSDETPQSKGGSARARLLSPQQRREIAVRAAQARWDKINDPNKLPVVSHKGPLKLGEVEVEAYRLNDGRRVISKRAMGQALGLKSAGGNAFLRTMTRKGVGSSIRTETWERINSPIFFSITASDLVPTTTTADGFEAETLIDVCNAIITAHHEGHLHSSQYFLYVRAEIIVRASAKLGITALVDAAVGYIKDGRREEYQKIFNQFLVDECRQWEKEFPRKLLDMIYRLYGLKRQDPNDSRTPRFFGQFIRRYIYFPLAQSRGAILEALDEKNPVVYANGGRKYKFHQFLTDEIGLPALRQHLWQVIGIGAGATNKTQFKKAFYRAFPEAALTGHQWDLLDELEDD